MFIHKKWLVILAVITTVLLLGACGDKKESGQTVDESIYDNPRNHTAEDFMPLSEGLEKHHVWFQTFVNPERNTSVNNVYVFENGFVTRYSHFGFDDELIIEKINDLTDDEIIKYAKEKSTAKSTGKYTLDITLDELGQSTKEETVILENGTEERIFPKGYDMDGEILTEDKTVTSKIDDLLTLTPESVNQKIFDTTYSGLGNDGYYFLITRVDESFVGFKLDDPDTKKKNVTIEGK